MTKTSILSSEYIQWRNGMREHMVISAVSHSPSGLTLMLAGGFGAAAATSRTNGFIMEICMRTLFGKYGTVKIEKCPLNGWKMRWMFPSAG